MSKNTRGFKRAVRTRMALTGESYMVAMNKLRAGGSMFPDEDGAAGPASETASASPERIGNVEIHRRPARRPEGGA